MDNTLGAFGVRAVYGTSRRLFPITTLSEVGGGERRVRKLRRRRDGSISLRPTRPLKNKNKKEKEKESGARRKTIC